MTVKRLPDPDQTKAAREAREVIEGLTKKHESLIEKEKALIAKYEEADQAGASIEELQALEKELASLERETELTERALQAADQEAAQARQKAEAGTKKAAEKEGKEIIKRILAAAEEIDQAQADYKAMAQELRQKVVFRKPNAENYHNYCGPDPRYIFNSQDQRFISWEETAKRFVEGRPARDRKKQERPQLAQEPGLYFS